MFKLLLGLGIPALILVVVVLYFYLGVQQENVETEMEMNPTRRIAHDVQIVREEPNNANAHWQLANSYVFAHRDKEAVEEYKKAVQLSHGAVNSGLYSSLGTALLATGQRLQAREAWKLEVKNDASDCQLVSASDRYSYQVTCGAWIEAKEMLKKYP